MSEKGILYIIQTNEYIGTNIYKIGMQKTNLTKLEESYKDAQIIKTIECVKPDIYDKKLKLGFANKFKQMVDSEYFEGNKNKLLDCFIDIIAKTFTEISNEYEKNKENEEKENEEKEKCIKCEDTGLDYWGEGTYTWCNECRCIYCGKEVCKSDCPDFNGEMGEINFIPLDLEKDFGKGFTL